MRRVASPKDRKYLESLNLKALQKSKPKGDQDPKEYYKALQEEATTGPLFTDKVLDTVEHLPDLPKPVSKWLGNMDDKELGKVDSQDLRLIIDWVQGSEDADIEGLSWDEAMEAQQNWHDRLHDDKEDCGEYQTHKVVFSTGGYEFVDLTTAKDLKVEGCKLKHCVGGDNYCRAVKDNHSRIISMRNSKNEPQVTIQYLVDNKTVEQCYGYKNHPPGKKLNEPLVKFFEHMGWYDGIFLLRNYTIPREKLEHILANRSISQLTTLLYNTKDPLVCEMLSTHDDARIRGDVALLDTTPAHTLEALAKDNNPYVRQSVAQNKHTPPGVLMALADDKQQAVIDAVAANHNTPQDVLIDIGSNHVVYNPNATADMLHGCINSWRTYVLEEIAKHPNTAPDDLRTLSEHEHHEVRSRVAENPNTPEDVLMVLVNGTDLDVVGAIALHATQESVLESVYSKHFGRRNINQRLVHNPHTPTKVLQSIADGDFSESYYAEQALRKRGVIARVARTVNALVS